MNTLKTSQVINAEFRLFEDGPVIRPFHGSFVAADPSLLTPEQSPDSMWHMFFHTTFGIWEAVSQDGISFKKGKKLLSDAMRPNINLIDGKYYLFFEHTRPLVFNALNVINAAKWRSEINEIHSVDLKKWSKPLPVLRHTREYEACERGVSISNPFYLRSGGVNRLYYSCGLTYIKDCGFCEPTYVSYAQSEEAASGYIASDTPILSPEPADPYLNLCSGCLKVYSLQDGYIGVQNGIYEKDGKSHSAILLLSSVDGLRFRFEKVLIAPSGQPQNRWMGQYVYSSHLVRCGDTLRLYFNARDKADALRGRECIGFAYAEIRQLRERT